MPEKDKPEAASPPKKAELRPVSEWAKTLGQYRAPGRFDEGDGFSAAHAAAATLHGWREHAHHAGAELELSEDDYRAAIDAAMPATGNPKAHKPALSKFCAHDGGLD